MIFSKVYEKISDSPLVLGYSSSETFLTSCFCDDIIIEGNAVIFSHVLDFRNLRHLTPGFGASVDHQPVIG